MANLPAIQLTRQLDSNARSVSVTQIQPAVVQQNHTEWMMVWFGWTDDKKLANILFKLAVDILALKFV